MSDLIKLIETYSQRALFDEDDNKMIVEPIEGASLADISKFEATNGMEMPLDLKELLLFSNGMDFFGLHILSLEEMEFFPNTGMISFHNWGTGDFDCLSTGGDYPKGSIIFMAHAEDNTSQISNNLVDWFESIFAEIEEVGALLHPMDYQYSELDGLYKNTSYQID